jgi:NADH:ubiquinone oxidoreductase subunit K
MMPIYFLGLSFAIFAAGICGMVASRHFLVMMLSSEAAIVASTLLSTMFFYFSANGDIIPLLLSLWSVASIEVMALVVVYRYLVKMEMGFDVTKMSNLKN